MIVGQNFEARSTFISLNFSLFFSIRPVLAFDQICLTPKTWPKTSSETNNSSRRRKRRPRSFFINFDGALNFQRRSQVMEFSSKEEKYWETTKPKKKLKHFFLLLLYFLLLSIRSQKFVEKWWKAMETNSIQVFLVETKISDSCFCTSRQKCEIFRRRRSVPCRFPERGLWDKFLSFQPGTFFENL